MNNLVRKGSPIRRCHAFGLALSAFGLSIALSGCIQPTSAGGFDFSKHNPSSQTENCNCVAVYSHRNNSSAAEEDSIGYLLGAGGTGGYINVVGVDGNPTGKLKNGKGQVIAPDEGISNKDLKDRSQKQKLSEAMESLFSDPDTLNAKEPEADIFAAIKQANDSFNSDDVDKGRPNIVIIADSGISTKGFINFTKTGIRMPNPEAEADKLFTSGAIAEGELSNIDRIDWYNFNSVSGEQSEIPGTRLLKGVQSYYEHILTRAGVGEVRFEETVKSNNDNAGKTDTSELPHVTVVDTGTIILNENSIKFDTASHEFTSRDEAYAILQPFVDELSTTDSTITIRGYTDTQPFSQEGGNQALSERRAERVKQALIELGLDANRITAIGEGESTAYPTDAENRRVEIKIEDE